MFFLWRGSNQSEGWPYVLQPVAQLPSVENSPCADTWGSDLGISPRRCSRQGFREDLECEDMQRIRHLSAIQIPIIQLLTRWCSRFLCVARPRCTGLPNALASRRSRKWFGIQQCELIFGNGERVQCLLQIQMPYWREDGAFEGDRAVPRHVAVTVCSSTTSRSGSHICCERGMRTFPPHSRSPSVWWWVLVKNWRQ